jgi:cation transport ATPase
MKKILAKLFGGVGSNIAEKISNIIDKHTFSKIEKAEFEKEMQEIFIKAESDIQQSVTERWKTDLNSDSYLSKNVRPMVLIFLIVSTVLMVFIDAGAINFNVDSEWKELLKLLLTTTVAAYFGGRSYEKIKR